ncbi:hypothetical protein [Gulosibacter sediminis]|uniref:hypothetical protein n=1 Tax=Gulosibacter sediminis TaxID=1729695 RepID=UPI0024A93ABD|nr:hypothetical protein [Gulosibacter sediminis]
MIAWKHSRDALHAIATCVGLALVLSGCTATAEEPHQDLVDTTENLSTEAPEFSGPWASEFTAAYQKAPNAQVREYLADEEISEAEKQTLTESFRTCLAAQGVTFDDFNEDGSFEFTFEESVGPDNANTIADECSASEGVDTAISLYYSIHANPENKDQSVDIAACMVRSGTVISTYSAEDYKSSPLSDYVLGDEAAAIEAVQMCESNPTGAFGG